MFWPVAVRVDDGFDDWSTRTATVVFRSKLPYGETHLSYRMIEGTPAVHVVWNGKRVECLLDTGTNYIESFRPMGLLGRDLGDGGRQTWAGGRTFPSRMVATTLKLKDISVYGAQGCVDGDKKMSANDMLCSVPILGEAFLERFCVTFDPVKHEVIFRSPDYVPPTHGALVLDIESDRQAPVLKGVLNGKPAKFTIDTGWNDNFVINASKVPDFSSKLKKVVIPPGPNQSVDFAEPCSLSFGGFKITRNVTPLCNMGTHTAGSIGWVTLSMCRTTFDYKRRHLILSPLK